MSEIVNQSLQKIAKGTGIIFIGTIIGMLLGFVGRVIIVRYITQSEYGIYSLALVLMSILVTISALGLQEGSTRYIAYFRGKKEGGKVRDVISTSIKIALIASVISSLILFLLSDVISTNIFHSSELSTPLKIFSAAIPFIVLMGIFTSIFRGFDRVEPNVYFQNIIRSVLFILFLVGAILLGLSFLGVLYAYLASLAITCIAFGVYTLKKLPLPTFSVKKGADAATAINPIGKELLLFSLPLLGIFMLNMIMQWTDTLMLGYFMTSDSVGLYNGALPFAQLIGIGMGAMSFIYVPIAAQLYSQNLMRDLKRTYEVLTKWLFSAVLPLFLVLFFFPEVVLNFLFGANYIGAGYALRILAICFFIHTFLGPNGVTLLIIGRTRFLMYASLTGAILNIILNITLIPLWGITGAATATMLSLGTAHVLNSAGLYQVSRIHPLTRNYLKPMFVSGVIIFSIYIIAKSFLIPSFWMLPLFFIIFIAIYILSLLLTKSFGNEDIMILLVIEKRLKVDTTQIKRILKKFF